MCLCVCVCLFGLIAYSYYMNGSDCIKQLSCECVCLFFPLEFQSIFCVCLIFITMMTFFDRFKRDVRDLFCYILAQLVLSLVFSVVCNTDSVSDSPIRLEDDGNKILHESLHCGSFTYNPSISFSHSLFSHRKCTDYIYLFHR